MQPKRINILQTILITGLNLVATLSLTALALLNFSMFYEYDPQRQVLVFAITTLCLFVLVYLATKAFILPELAKYRQRKTLAFIALLAAILAAVFAASAVYYWSVPTDHQVEICFDAVDGERQISIDKMVEPITNRLYTPAGFGRYPLTIRSGACEKGRITTLYSIFSHWWEIPRVTVMLRDDIPAGRFFLSINDVPAVVQFEDAPGQEPQDEITFRDGFEHGSVHTFARHRTIYLALKGLMLLVSALYLAMFFFGLSERITTDASNNTNTHPGNDNA